MTKAKKKSTKKEKKKLTRLHVFCLGLIVGFGFFLLPVDEGFSPVKFTESSSGNPSIFSQYLPQTTPIIKREGYILAYDGRMRNAHWVYHKLTDIDLKKTTTRDLCDFQEDPLIPKQIRVTKSDYQNTGYDRGHLCPAADCDTQKTMDESFFFSNISPQVPAFNRGYWKKMENHVRSLTKEYPVVHVFSGPLYLKSKGRDGKHYVKYEVIGAHDVAVPTHFFTLIFVENSSKKMQGKAYIIPNKSISAKTPLKKFSASIEEVEISSGTSFTQMVDQRNDS